MTPAATDPPRCPYCPADREPTTSSSYVYYSDVGYGPYVVGGVTHLHDANRRMQHWVCSNGHAWNTDLPYPKCPGCSWPEGDTP